VSGFGFGFQDLELGVMGLGIIIYNRIQDSGWGIYDSGFCVKG
jgi:hypothetical protein